LADHGSKLGREHQLYRPSGAEEVAMIIVTKGIPKVEESWGFLGYPKTILCLRNVQYAMTSLVYV
jgi:hypothetical protein